MLTTVLYISSGKYLQMYVAFIESDPNFFDGALLKEASLSLKEAALGFIVLNELLGIIFILVGYFLIWRVNRRNTWALYTLTIYMLLWLIISVSGSNQIFNLPGYHTTSLDYLNLVVGSLFAFAIAIRPFFGWKKTIRVA